MELYDFVLNCHSPIKTKIITQVFLGVSTRKSVPAQRDSTTNHGDGTCGSATRRERFRASASEV